MTAKFMLPRPVAGCRSRLGRACGRQGSSADACGCGKRRRNAHGTEERQVLYELHPWFGRLARLHEVIEKSGGKVGELEMRWNKTLTHAADIETKIAAHAAARPPREIAPLSLTDLASDLKSVWSAPTTDTRLKKRIVRTMIHEVVADIDTEAAEIMLAIHWVGGIHTGIRLPRRRKG